MRRPSFALRLAVREARGGIGRVGVYMASITLGVAALVALHSFRDDVARSIDEQARVLMGADARLSSNRPLPDSVTSIVDSLTTAGGETARVTTAVSMVLAPATDRVRLLQVRGVEGEWPFYGAVRTSPPGRWGRHRTAGSALVDPAVLTQLGVEVGDTLVLGSARVSVAGTVEDVPTDLGFQTAVGPRIWISEAELRGAGLLGFGSLARYETFFRLPDERDAGTVWVRYGELFRAAGTRFTTSGEQARELTDALDFMARYLGLVGLGALLLGGVGVASAIHVYVTEKLDGVAVLRCIGARQWTVFRAYLIQAAALGFAGAAAGVAVGVAVQQLLPSVLAGVLPLRVDPRISVSTVGAGLGVGVGVAVLFALVPLLAVRDVPPLRALRKDVEKAKSTVWADPWRLGGYLLLGLAVVGLSVLEAGSTRDGLAFSGALAGTTALLWLSALLLIRGTRRFFPSRAPYTLRQGVANLFRPRNQTVSVTLALGFGAFVVGTVLQVQSSLADHLALEEGEDRPNLLLFDVQPDQVEGVIELLPEPARREASLTPIVPARIASLGRRDPDGEGGPAGRRAARWALRREYRNTYRRELRDTEEIVAGEWFGEDPGAAPAGTGEGDRPARVSLEEDLAGDLRVGLGDTITWDVGGRPVVSVVTSLRRVDWERFATNFFVVFEPGALEEAPQTTVVLTRLEPPAVRAAFVRDLVDAYPNVSALDLARIQEAVAAILAQVDRAVRFLAVFSAMAGLLVLAGAVASSHHQRMGEGALLRTLGARRRQVVSVLLSEYVALAAAASAAGLGLALVAAALVVRRMFGIPFVPSALSLALVWGGVTALTVGVGMLGSRRVLGRPPLPTLRRTAE